MSARDLRALPKAHLHLHLEGAMRPSTLVELAGQAGVTAPDVASASTFTDFIALYVAACAVLTGPGSFERLFLEIAEDARDEGVVWVEAHVDPGIYRDVFSNRAELLDWFQAAAEAAEAATGVGVGLIVSADRTRPVADALELAALAAAHAGDRVVGFGLANDEVGHPPELFADAFTVAGEAGLLSVPHAGELAGPASVRGALDALGPARLGHGVRAVENADLVKRLADEDVCCDVCPTSNLKLGIYPSIGRHAIGALMEAGVPVTLNADDPLMFGSSLLDEYALVRDGLVLDDEEIAAIARTSIERSGMPVERRTAALDGIATWLD